MTASATATTRFALLLQVKDFEEIVWWAERPSSERNVTSLHRRRRALSKAPSSAGSNRRASCPCVKTSRMFSVSGATIARPSCQVLKQLEWRGVGGKSWQDGDIKRGNISGHVVALNDAGDGQSVSHPSLACMLLQGVAGWAVTHHKNMQVKPRMVQGYEVDQSMDFVPAANKAGEAKDQARWQPKSRLGGADVSIDGKSLRIDAIRDDGDGGRPHPVIGHDATQYAE